MVKKTVRKNIIRMICMLSLLLASTTALAAAESYNTYYKFSCSTASSSHSASGTPTVKITTSNMKGDSSDKLYVGLEKKYLWGWAQTGSEKDQKYVSSVFGDTFSLKGNGKGSYRLLFGKSSMLLSGKYDTSSPKWYADLKISYNK